MGQVAILLLLPVLCACAQPQPHQQGVYDPTLGVHVTRTGQVIPSASANVAGVTLGASTGGGYVGTRVGPIRLSAGF